jgi:uracil-DNA glycosylase
MTPTEQEELFQLARAARELTEEQLRAGFRSETPAAKTPGAEGPAEPTRSLDEVRADLGDCTRCKLHRGRTHLVFGVGNPKADLLFVGEAPGRDEDLQGEPFVGRAGQLLTDIIGAIGLKRNEVYICNVVKCRPPENRNPEPEEIEACVPYLRAQIRSVGPKVICALGKFAAQVLLGVETPISRLRGEFREVEGVPVMPTYHPAYLLRNPAAKREVWEDFKKVHAELCRRTGRALVRKGA